MTSRSLQLPGTITHFSNNSHLFRSRLKIIEDIAVFDSFQIKFLKRGGMQRNSEASDNKGVKYVNKKKT